MIMEIIYQWKKFKYKKKYSNEQVAFIASKNSIKI